MKGWVSKETAVLCRWLSETVDINQTGKGQISTVRKLRSRPFRALPIHKSKCELTLQTMINSIYAKISSLVRHTNQLINELY